MDAPTEAMCPTCQVAMVDGVCPKCGMKAEATTEVSSEDATV